MATCPKCSTEVPSPVKSWGLRNVTMGLFECPSCNYRFQSKVQQPKPPSPLITKEPEEGVVKKPLQPDTWASKINSILHSFLHR